jgi:hypothetical protein
MYCENHTKDRNVVCGGERSTEILNVKSVGGLKTIYVRVKVCNSFLHKISKTIGVREDKVLDRVAKTPLAPMTS